MMTNLFSVFDPSSSIMASSWSILLIVSLLIPIKMFLISSPLKKISKKLNLMFKKETKFSLGKKEKGTENMILLVFFMIISMNFIALYPSNFSPTSHLTVTLPLALVFWLTLMLFGWTKNTNHMLSHLVPMGTPSALMAFMVMIEMVSNLIRPITLCVRLTANLIAGHLLMTLLGNFMLSLPTSFAPMVMILPLSLSILESAVACIQAYVFMTLITLYTTEIK